MYYTIKKEPVHMSTSVVLIKNKESRLEADKIAQEKGSYVMDIFSIDKEKGKDGKEINIMNFRGYGIPS